MDNEPARPVRLDAERTVVHTELFGIVDRAREVRVVKDERTGTSTRWMTIGSVDNPTHRRRLPVTTDRTIDEQPGIPHREIIAQTNHLNYAIRVRKDGEATLAQPLSVPALIASAQEPPRRR